MAFESLSDKLSEAFKRLRSKGKLKESDVKEAMREVRLALLEADVNYKVAKDFIAAVTEKAIGDEVLESLTPAQQVIKIVNDEMTALMGSVNARINMSSKIPTIIMMCGLQGAGKTTHSGKLALYFKNQGKRPLLVACDVYRPAAIKQLQVVGEKIGVPVFEMGAGNPVEIAQKAVSHAKDHGNDIVILDTAGRLHIDANLNTILSILLLMGMAFLLSLCSSSDAIVARSFANQFPFISILGFLVFGPMIDIKNLTMLSGNFSKKFIAKLTVTVFFVCFFVMCICSFIGLERYIV